MVRGLEKGENYDKLKKSIVIVILKDSCLPESEPAHSCFVLKNQRTGYELSEMAQLHILELGKYNWRGKKAKELGYAEGHAEGHAEGLAEGIAEGRKDEKLNIARRLKAKNMRPEEILEITGLTLEEIEKI